MQDDLMNTFFVLFVVSCLICLGCGEPCTTYDSVTLQVHDPYTKAQFVGYIAAQKQAYFSAECLNVTILFRDADTVIDAVLANSAQFGTHFMPAILDDDDRPSLVVLSQIFQRSGFRIVWPTTSSIQGNNLKGKVVGRINSLGQNLQAQLLASSGTASAADFVFFQNPEITSPMSWGVDALSALTYKQYASLLTSLSSQSNALITPNDIVAYNNQDFSLLEDCIFVSKTWLATGTNSDVAARFIKAALKGWIYCRDFESECVTLFPAPTNALAQFQLREVNKLIWPSPLGIGRMNQTAFLQTAQIMQVLNFAKNYTYPLVYDMSITNEVLLNDMVGVDTGAIGFNKTSLSFCASGNSYIICNKPNTPPEESSLGLGTIVVIIIPVSVTIAILAGVGLFLVWRRRALVKAFLGDDGSGGTGYQINFDELAVEAKIGSGSFGDVYKGTWRDTPVAVKRLRSQLVDDQLDELNREAVIMLQLRHPHIVLFMGCCNKVPNVCLVTEFMPKGSLFDVLHDERVDLPWDRRLSLAKDTAKGLAFLHGSDPPTLHNDLKSSNLLVSHNWICKVSDFGLTSLKGTRTQDELLGSLFWMAPEVLNNEPATEKSDVYSFGVILWELASRAEPYENMSWAAVRVGVMKRKLRPAIPKYLYAKYQDYVELIKDCWEQDPMKRPSFTRILKRLEDISNRVAKEIKAHNPPTGDKISIVFSDIQNSAYLWENCPIEMKEAMAMHNDIIRNTFREFRGYEVRSDGDSFMIAFASAKDACGFSVRVTETLLATEWNPELLAWLEDEEGKHSGEDGYEEVVFKGVRVRMGMHHGPCESTRDPITDRVEYTGATPAKAARLSISAQGGQIFVSSKFYEEVIGELHTISNPPPYLMPVGTIYLKGFPEPELVYQVLSPSLIGRHKKYMATPSNQSAVIWQDQTNNLDSMFSGQVSPKKNRPMTLSAYPQDLTSISVPRNAPGSARHSNGPVSLSPYPTPNQSPFATPGNTPGHTPGHSPGHTPGHSPDHTPEHSPHPTPHGTPANSPHHLAPINNPTSPTPNLPPLGHQPNRPVPLPAPAALNLPANANPPSPKPPSNAGQQQTPNPPAQTSRKITPRNIEQNTFTIDFNEIQLGEEIGHGSYGVVMKGKWRGQQVAVKKLLRGKVKQEILTEFYNEVQIMCNLRCPHLVLFMGACFKPPNLCIVTELMPRNLFQVLHDPRINVNGVMRLKWAKHIALGMNYLHKLNLIHRDLKSNNLLVDNSWNVKITDFGFARVKTTNQTMTKCGTVNWIAPEIAEGHKYTEKSDVYSYAITLYEILTRKVPFGNQTANEVLEKVLEGKRPEIPSGSPPKLVKLISMCWEQEYERRPSFEEVLNYLETWTDKDCE